MRAAYDAILPVLLRAEGNAERALAVAEVPMKVRAGLGAAYWSVKEGYVQVLEGAAALGDESRLEAVLDDISTMYPIELTPYLRTQAARFWGRLAAMRGDSDAAESAFDAAEKGFRKIGATYLLAISLVEHTESMKPERLVEREHMLEEAENIFVALGAEPWESRLESLRSMPSSVATGTDS